MVEEQGLPPIIRIGFVVICLGLCLITSSWVVSYQRPAHGKSLLHGINLLSKEAALVKQPGEKVKAKMSWYNPALLGVNCARVRNGKCVSHMANGERWQDWINKGACACPREYAFGTVFEFPSLNLSCICKDRGGKIVTAGKKVWIDLLTTKPPVKFGTVIEAYVIR